MCVRKRERKAVSDSVCVRQCVRACQRVCVNVRLGVYVCVRESLIEGKREPVSESVCGVVWYARMHLLSRWWVVALMCRHRGPLICFCVCVCGRQNERSVDMFLCVRLRETEREVC